MNFMNHNTVIERRRSTPTYAAAHASHPEPAQAFKLDLARSLRTHTKLAAGVAIAIFLLIALYALTRTPMYQAQSLVYVEPAATKVLSDGSAGIYDPSRYDSYLQQQIQTIERKDILETAIAGLPAGTWKEPGESDDDAATRLQSALKVQRVLQSYQISISLTGPNAEATTAVVNAVTSAFLQQGRKDSSSRTDPKLQLLTEERARVQTELDQDKTEQAALSATLGVANPAGESGNQYDVQLTNTRSELAAAREAHDIAEAQLSSVLAPSGAATPGLSTAADEVIAGDAGLSSMKSSISARRATLSSQMAGLTPNNPVYKQDQNEIADLDKALDKLTTQLRGRAEVRLQDKLRLDLRRTGDVESRLNSQLAQQTAAAAGAAPKLQRATELAADMQRLSARYATVDDDIRGLQLEASGPGAASLVLPATVPTSPEASKRMLLLLLALPLALMAGAAAAVIARKRDKHIYNSDDVTTVLGFVPIGVVPALHEVSNCVMEEYALRLAAGIEGAYRKGSARSYLFTAASATTDIRSCVDAVRETLGRLGFKVTAVDVAELLRPALPVEAREGDATSAAGAQTVALTPAPERGREGVAAANLERLKQVSDLVLILAPPLLESASSEYAARTADATILVAESGVTLNDELLYAAELLERLHAPGVGVVVQDMQLKYADHTLERTGHFTEQHSPSLRVADITERCQEMQQPLNPASPKQPAKEKNIENPKPSIVFYDATTSSSMHRSAKQPRPATPKTFGPTPSAREATLPVRVPFESTQRETDVEQVEKTNWVQRLFHLQDDPVLSIAPQEEAEDEDVAAVPLIERVEASAPAFEPLASTPQHVQPPVLSFVEPTIQVTVDVVPVVAAMEPAIADSVEVQIPSPEMIVIELLEAEALEVHELVNPIEAPIAVLTPAMAEVHKAAPIAISMDAEQSTLMAALTPTVAKPSDAHKPTEDEWSWTSGIKLPEPAPEMDVLDVPPAFQATEAPIGLRPAPISSKAPVSALTLSAVPGVVTSIAKPAVTQREIATPYVHAVDVPQRAALAKAAAKASLSGPARFADSLAARREIAPSLRPPQAQQNLARHMEAGYRQHTDHPVLSRRWHMLSQFDHGRSQRAVEIEEGEYASAASTRSGR